MMNLEEQVEANRQLQIKYKKLAEDGNYGESVKVKEEYLLSELKLIRSTNTVKTFNPLTLNNIVTEPTEIVCKDFIPLIKGAFNLIAGAGGVGKSTIAIRSAMHYLRANPTKRAFLAMGEDDKDEVENRVKSIGEGFLHLNDDELKEMIVRMDFTTIDNPISMRFLEMRADGAKLNTQLISSFEEYLKSNNIGFVVLDPLKKFHSVNENSNSEMDLLVRDVFLEMAGKLKIVMLLLHHSAKSNDSMGSRGASTISDTARIAYKLSKFYIKDPNSGALIEDNEKIGVVKISTIKDNKNIFSKFGYKNTNNGEIELYPKNIPVYETVYEMETI